MKRIKLLIQNLLAIKDLAEEVRRLRYYVADTNMNIECLTLLINETLKECRQEKTE